MDINNLQFFNREGDNLNLKMGDDGVWRGNIYFQPLSVALYENENIFMLEKISDNYYFPIIETDKKITFRWETKEFEENLFLYEVLEDTDTELPYIHKIDRLDVEYDSSLINVKVPLQFNVAFNPLEEKAYDSTLKVYYDTTLIAEIYFYGEGLEEDERFGVWLENFGFKFNKEDALIIKDYDIREANPNWDDINVTRKELLVNKEEIFPYVGTYKGLINIINILGYKDLLHVKEYWKNIKETSAYFNKYLLSDITDVLEEGRVESLDMVKFNKEVKFDETFKKTGFLALSYEFTRATDEFDEDGVPIIESTTDLTFNEMFFKLNGVKRFLEKRFIPTNVVIKDIIGEFIYFVKYVYRYWDDRADVKRLEINEDIPLKIIPESKKLTMRELKPLHRILDDDGINFPVTNFNTTNYNPYDLNQKLPPNDMSSFVSAIEEYYKIASDDSGPFGAKDVRPWELGDDFDTRNGCPVVLYMDIPELTIEEMRGVNTEELPEYFNFGNLKYKNLYDVEWTISKPAPQPYSWTFRGQVKDYWKIAHIFPYEGQYTIKLRVFDFMGSASLRIESDLTIVKDNDPEIIALRKVEDKFDYTISNLDNVRFSDFGLSKWHDVRLNVLDNADDKDFVRKNILNTFFYRKNLYDIKIKNDEGVFIDYSESEHPLKNQWAFNGKYHLTLEDLEDVKISDLYFLRGSDTIFQSEYLPGFYFSNAAPGDKIKFNYYIGSPQRGYDEYTIPTITPFTNEALVTEMNNSTHPAVSLFNYEVINDRIHAQARTFGYDTLMIIDYVDSQTSTLPSSPGSPSGISGDKYTFTEPSFLFDDDFLDLLEEQYPNFDRELLFLDAPLSDKLSGEAGDIEYWEDKDAVELLDGDQKGHLPSTYLEDYFRLSDLKIHNSSFFTPMYSIVFFALNNMSYVRDVVWTLYSEDDQEDVIVVRNIPFFVWRFNQSGKYTIKARVIDGNGNESEVEYKDMVNVLNKVDYMEYVERRLDERAHKEQINN